MISLSFPVNAASWDACGWRKNAGINEIHFKSKVFA
jgi:hypothetical protein